MDTVITRIIEIERESAREIERAEAAYRKNIEAHRHTLELEKERARTGIISAENARFTQAISELNRRTQEASLASAREYERRFHSPDLVGVIKKRIVDILLK